MNIEIWKDVAGYEGRYEVSNYGRVKSIQFHGKPREKIMKAHLDQDGYLKLVLCIGCQEKSWFVHRLVAIAFVPNPTNEATVNHRNGIKTVNFPDNLEWLSFGENTKHALRTGLINNNGRSKKLNDTYVRFIRKKKGIFTQKELGDLFGVSDSMVNFIQNGQAWRHVI